MTFAEKLNRYRTMKQLSLTGMASQLGVSSTVLSQLESGQAQPEKEFLDQLVAHSGFRYEDWFNEDTDLPLLTVGRVQTADQQQAAYRQRIRRLIADKTPSGKQEEFAELVGLHPTMLSKMLSDRSDKGGRPIDIKHLLQIEAHTGARLAWLRTGQEPVYHPEGALPVRPVEEMHDGAQLFAFLERHRDRITQQDLADALGKSKSSVSGYQHSSRINPKTKQQILDALSGLLGREVTLDEVFNTPIAEPGSRVEATIRPVTVSEDPERVKVLKVPIRARAGFGYVAYFTGPAHEQEYIAIPKDRLYNGVPAKDHVIIEINGDSMEPRLQKGYEMLAYRLPADKYPKLNSVVVIDFKDELTIKELVKIDWVAKSITLRSENGGAEMIIPMEEIRAVFHVYEYYRARL